MSGALSSHSPPWGYKIMINRRKLLAILGIGVSAFVLNAHPAHAARGMTFAPATSWSVSRIDPTNGGAAYCTLARRFDGNTVITFARNTAGEGTIAVDFQQSLFDPNQTYRIGLQAGNGLQREFMTRPATPNAIVLRTGQDPQFFNALSQANELGVILDKTRHAFTIPDFGSGTTQLSTCIGDAPSVQEVTPAKTAMKQSPRASGPAAAAPESDAVKELRAELNALRQENAGIVASLKQGSVETVQAAAAMPQTQENQQLVAKLASLEGEKNALVEKLQNERSRQQQEANDEATMKQALEDQKALKSMLEAERQQRAELELALTEKTAEAEKRGELRARIESLESSNAELKTLRETLETERQKRLAAEKMLQDQKMASANTLEEQERLRTRVSELETQNKSLQQNVAVVEDMKVQLEDTGTRASMERARREAAEKALQEMQLSASEREASITKMQQQLESERAKLAAAETAKEAELTKKHMDQIALLNAEMEKLRLDDAKAAELAAKITAEKEKTAALDMKAATEQARREAAERMLADVQKEREATLAKMTSELESARKPDPAKEAEVARLKNELENARKPDPAKEAEVARLKTELDNARKAADEVGITREEVTAKQAEIKKLQDELALANKKAQEAVQTANMGETAKAEEIARLNTEIEKLRKDNMAKVVDAGDNARMKEISDKLAEMEGRNSDLMDQLAAANARKESAEKAAMSTTSNDPATNAKIVEMGRKAEADRRELQALLEAEQARREKLEGIMAKGGSETDRMKEMSNQISELNKRNVDLETRLREARANDIAPAAGENNNADLEALRKQLAVLKADNSMLAEKLASGASTGKGAEKIVYAGDDQIAEELAESKSSLASVMAERDEYRGLLQRERQDRKEETQGGKKSDKKDAKVEDKGANARIAALEAERVELVRQLEFERARLENIAAGREAAPSAAEGQSEGEINQKLAAVEAEKANLKKQLEIAQKDVIAAREKIASGKGATDADLRQLLQENKKLQAELAASAASGGGDSRAMQTEIAALRAQNNILNDEINKRLAAAPSRAQMDNVAAEANYKVKEAKQVAKQEVSADLNKANTRFQQAEQENIRLAQELAKARMQPIVSADQPMATISPQIQQQQPQPTIAQMQMQPQPVPQQPKMQPVMAQAQPAPMPETRSMSQQQQMPSQMYQQASVAPLPPQAAGPTGSDIAAYLKRAGIPMTAGFEKINKVATPQFGAFRWDTGVVFGTAEQQVVPEKNFEQAVNNYINKTQARCSGTFDKSFDASQMTQHKDVAVADVACVMPDGSGAGAAMLFYYKDGVFTAVAHEGDISQFEQAMTTRDQLARFMNGVI